MRKKQTITPTNSRSPQPADVIVGLRIKAARLRQQVSQETLGKALGVSFQQIQKYEKGVNRIGASRMMALATALQTPITEFYADTKQSKKSVIATEFEEFLATKDGTDLVHAVLKIDDQLLRRKLVEMARVMARVET